MTAGALIFLGFCMVAASFIIVSVRIFQVRPDPEFNYMEKGYTERENKKTGTSISAFVFLIKTTASIDWENKW